MKDESSFQGVIIQPQEQTMKQQAIQACRDLEHRYRNPGWCEFFLHRTCPLCKIFYLSREGETCRGCPLAGRNPENDDEKFGCTEFQTYKNAEKLYEDEEDYEVEFNARADFFVRIIPILEAMPEERFTLEGWKYTGDLIPREW
jgi:hypothetical protein